MMSSISKGFVGSMCVFLLFFSASLANARTACQAGAAALLLCHLGWNKEKLIEKYVDNTTKMLVAAGVTMSEPQSQSTPKAIRLTSNNTLTELESLTLSDTITHSGKMSDSTTHFE
ncbi:hypothetical protein C8J56DRAFT_492432 [Mycena floridula]|nr:hypothetical protein C8J56DRAFT_492432 [Mycena floridula]